jgi:hypothetical protein
VTSPAPASYWQNWYEVINDLPELRQGDLFRDLTVALIPEDLPQLPASPGVSPTIDVELTKGDWIVLSASCDVSGDKLHGHALLASVLPATEQTLNASGQKALEEKMEVIRRGWDPARFLLAEFPSSAPPLPLSFVQYRAQALMPLAYLRRQCVGPRLRMRPPFREKLAAWAGSALARVGIEDSENIPQFKKQIFAAQIVRALDGT